MATVCTIGHGTRTSSELIEALRTAGVEHLIDVRRFPGSRRHPQFARARLESDLPAANISYSWWGEEMGGRRKPVADSRHLVWRNSSFRAYADHMDGDVFRTALVRLENLAKRQRVAVMCAETLWWRCHRRLIADVLVLRRHEVLHIIGPGEEQVHAPNPSARSDGNGWIVYDVGETPSLEI